jgi:type IV pilus assembly protein PilX
MEFVRQSVHNDSPISKRRGLQQGVTLLFALMSLVILGLAAVALTRSVDTGVLIMGNLGFKQDTVVSGGSGAEQAILWLQTNMSGSALDSDIPASGYYAASRDKLDPTGGQTSAANPLPLVNWDGNCQGAVSGTYSLCDVLPAVGAPVNGNSIQWVITRLCLTTGAAAGANLCARPPNVNVSGAKERGELNAGGRISSAVAGPYYRIIVRITGPRNTVSYTESLVHF